MPQFYADFLNKPQPLNNFQTMNRYWMEDSFGKYGVEVVPFGPYRLPLKSYQYHINTFQNTTRRLPEPGQRDAEPDAVQRATSSTAARNAWRADINAEATPGMQTDFDNQFWTSAGQDESGAWQEFGEMRFVNQDAVTDAFGPKHINPLHPRGNWATTRYIPWTSWAAAANVWPQRLHRQQLDRGRERRHVRLRARALAQPRHPGQLQQPVHGPHQRTAAGMWDMMSRGSFNGPGGQHTRWQIPPTQGSALGAQHSAAQQALPELHHRRRHPAAEPRRSGPDGHGGRGDQGP